MRGTKLFFTLMTLKGLLVIIPIAEVYSKEVNQREEFVPIEVIGERLILPTKEPEERVHTGYEITLEGMRLLQTKGQMNVWQVLELLPGVFFESTDPANLAGEQTSIRVRGIRGVLGTITVMGVPNYGGNPIGPRSYLYDLENFESIAVYKGAIPESLATGVGTRGGLVELRPLFPMEKPSVNLSLTTGNFDFRRVFARFDTGTLSNLNTKLSVSASYTEADKWKGLGKVGPRKNLNLQLHQPLTPHLDLKLFFNLNDQKYHRYRYLSYTEVLDLEKNRRLDFVNDPTSHLHFEYNKAEHLNRDLMAFLSHKLSRQIKLSLKGYLTSEDADILEGVSNLMGRPGVQRRIRDHERRGLIPEIFISFGQHSLSLGYHYERSLMEIFTENYWINGTNLQYRGLGVVASASPTYTHSPYLQISGNFGKCNYKLGLKYFYMREEPGEGFVWNTTTMSLQRAPDLDRERRTYDIFLPSFGISYSLREGLEVYGTYGRTFIRPYAYLPLVSLYNRLRGNFTRAGVTLKELFRGLDIERTDTLELGIRGRKGNLEGNVVLYYSYHDKLLTMISDPRVLDGGRPVSYRQNVGTARGLGIEGNFQYFFGRNSYFFLNPTYQVLTYAKDIEFRGMRYAVKGKQVVDTPRVLIVSGLNLRIGNWSIMPRLKYQGKRYGDLAHREKIGDYLVADLNLTYSLPKFYTFKDVSLTLEVNNVFDRKYISLISTFDDAVEGTTYGIGAPFSVRFGLKFRY